MSFEPLTKNRFSAEDPDVPAVEEGDVSLEDESFWVRCLLRLRICTLRKTLQGACVVMIVLILVPTP